MRIPVATSLATIAALAALHAPPAAAQGETDLLVYSTASGGGALTLATAGVDPIAVTPRLPFCPGGICPYSSVNPGFLTPDTAAGGLFPLARGTRISLELVAIDAAASIKVGSTILKTAGEAVALGTAPDIHVHPEWQLQAAQGVVGDYPVMFRLTTTGAYAPSATYSTTLTNRVGGAPTATPTATPLPATASPTPSATPTAADTAVPSPSTTAASPSATATDTVTPAASTTATDPPATPTSAPAPCAGDCNGDGSVAVNELITGVNIALGTAPADACDALDRDDDGGVAVPELVQAVNRAVGGC